MNWHPATNPPDLGQCDETELYLKLASGRIIEGSYNQDTGWGLHNMPRYEDPIEWAYLWETPLPISPPPDGIEARWF